MADSPVRVVIIEDSPVLRAGLASMLGHTDGIRVVGAAENPARAELVCVDREVDVAVIGPEVLGLAPDAATARRVERCAGMPVVVLTDVVDELVAQAVSSSKVNACLDVATVRDHDLVRAVHGAMDGRATFSSGFLRGLVDRGRGESPSTCLTARENDILELLAQGQTNASIGHELGLSAGTVKVYVSAILGKLHAPNRTAAAVHAIQEGLVDPPAGDEEGATGPTSVRRDQVPRWRPWSGHRRRAPAATAGSERAEHVTGMEARSFLWQSSSGR